LLKFELVVSLCVWNSRPIAFAVDFVQSFIRPKLLALIQSHDSGTSTPTSSIGSASPSVGGGGGGLQSRLFELNALVDTASKMFASSASASSSLLGSFVTSPPSASPLSASSSDSSDLVASSESIRSLSPTQQQQQQELDHQEPQTGPVSQTSQQSQALQQRSVSSRFANQTVFELRSMLLQVRKATAPSALRSLALFQAMHDLVVFRIQLYQYYTALGSRRLRSLSMERASLTVAALVQALERSPLATFDPLIATLARCEAAALAALLRTVSHTARLQFVPAMLSAAEARSALIEWTSTQASALKLPSLAVQSLTLASSPGRAAMNSGDASASMTYGAAASAEVSGAVSYVWIYEWLDAFASSCVAHIELVFAQHLKACIGVSLSTLPATPKASLIQLIDAFVAKSEAHAFGLVLDCNRSARASVLAATSDEKPPPITFSVAQPFVDVFAATPAPPSGEPPTGIASWPVIFARPESASLREHMPNIISIVLDQAASLLSTRATDPLLQTDNKIGCAYALIRMGEPHLFGVAIWLTRSSKYADFALRHMPQIAALSRHTALFDAVHDRTMSSARGPDDR
jgi:hypothetical protein